MRHFPDEALATRSRAVTGWIHQPVTPSEVAPLLLANVQLSEKPLQAIVTRAYLGLCHSDVDPAGALVHLAKLLEFLDPNSFPSLHAFMQRTTALCLATADRYQEAASFLLRASLSPLSDPNDESALPAAGLAAEPRAFRILAIEPDSGVPFAQAAARLWALVSAAHRFNPNRLHPAGVVHA